jgi:hypothetical protein
LKITQEIYRKRVRSDRRNVLLKKRFSFYQVFPGFKKPEHYQKRNFCAKIAAQGSTRTGSQVFWSEKEQEFQGFFLYRRTDRNED